MSGVAVAKPLSINITSIVIDGSNIITLNPIANQDLSVVSNGSYVTLNGFCPDDASQVLLAAATPPVTFPYWINGPLWKVTSSNGSSPVAVDVILNVPAFGNSISIILNPSTVIPTAYMHVKSDLKIMQYTTGEESGTQAYAGTYESGPSIDFKYKNNNIQVTFAPTPVPTPVLPEIGTIVFDKGLTAWGKTYQVTFSSLKSGTTVSYTVLPTGVLTQP